MNKFSPAEPLLLNSTAPQGKSTEVQPGSIYINYGGLLREKSSREKNYKRIVWQKITVPPPKKRHIFCTPNIFVLTFPLNRIK